MNLYSEHALNAYLSIEYIVDFQVNLILTIRGSNEIMNVVIK